MNNPQNIEPVYAVDITIRFFIKAIALEGGAAFDPVGTTRDELAHSELAELLAPLLAQLSDADLPAATVTSITAEPVQLE